MSGPQRSDKAERMSGAQERSDKVERSQQERSDKVEQSHMSEATKLSRATGAKRQS